MDVIAVTSRKGGCAKSSTAVGLSIAAATRSPRHIKRPVVLIDCDRRASAAEWLSNQPVEGIDVLESPTERMLERVAATKFDEASLLVIDTPNSSDNPSLIAIAHRMSSFVVIPSRVGGLELSALSESIHDVLLANRPYGVVLSATITGSRSLAATKEQLNRLNIPLLGNIKHTVALAAAGLTAFPMTSLLAYEDVLEKIDQLLTSGKKVV